MKRAVEAAEVGIEDWMGVVVVEDANPDDAAAENNGNEEPEGWPCICHGQFGGPCEELVYIRLSPALSCHFSFSFQVRETSIFLLQDVFSYFEPL